MISAVNSLTCNVIWYNLFLVRWHLVGLGLLIVEAPRSHSDVPHSVEFLWTSDQPDSETSI